MADGPHRHPNRTSPARLAPDRGEISRFVETLFRHVPTGGVVHVRAFFDDKPKSDEPPFEVVTVRVDGGGLAPVVDAVARAAARAAGTLRPTVVAVPVALFSGEKADEAGVCAAPVAVVELDRHPRRCGDLRSTSKGNPSMAPGACIGVTGHITLDEPRREMTATDAASGFANRFLFGCVRCAGLLPDGGRHVDLSGPARKVDSAIARARNGGRMARDPEAPALWRRIYPKLTAERPGMLGAVTARAEAQVLRLSMVYALLDGTFTIGVPHLEAALEVWRYCRESAAHVFGDRLGDEVADTIVAALRRSPEGLSRTNLRDLFARHAGAARVSEALARLVRDGMAVIANVRTEGRPKEVVRLADAERRPTR